MGSPGSGGDQAADLDDLPRTRARLLLTEGRVLPGAGASCPALSTQDLTNSGGEMRDPMYTKEADILVRPALTSDDGIASLSTAMSRRFTGSVEALQTEAARNSRDVCPAGSRRLRPASHCLPAQEERANLYGIECFNRTLPKECFG